MRFPATFQLWALLWSVFPVAGQLVWPFSLVTKALQLWKDFLSYIFDNLLPQILSFWYPSQLGSSVLRTQLLPLFFLQNQIHLPSIFYYIYIFYIQFISSFVFFDSVLSFLLFYEKPLKYNFKDLSPKIIRLLKNIYIQFI